MSDGVLWHCGGVHPQLSRALEPVLRDLRATGVPLPARIDGDDWADSPDVTSAMVWSRHGDGTGIRVTLDEPLADQVARVTEQLQDWAFEELMCAAATNWPPCPRHPGTHPLQVRVGDGTVLWACARDDVPITPVGSLG